MAGLKRSVPSLGALATFEAAARCGGFTKAAEELNVTQAAVSKQIRQLEDDLGVSLFRRTARRVELTDEGKVLADVVGESFSRIAEAIGRLRSRSAGDYLTISVSLSFSHFWLLPRLPDFRARYPHFKIRVVTQDTAIDLRQGTADVAVRFGVPPFIDGRTTSSLPDIAVPVCSREYMDRIGSDVRIGDLAILTLIDTDSTQGNWLSWPRWFQTVGLPPVTRQDYLTFNHYSDAVYAAINGEGVVIGWQKLLERPLSDGRLVQFGEDYVEPNERHHLVVANGKSERAPVQAFVDWLSGQFDAVA